MTREEFLTAVAAALSPEVRYNPADLFGWVSAYWTPDCDWTPEDAAEEFAAASANLPHGEG